MTFNTELWNNQAPGAGGYTIERSLRFNSADSAYLNRTPGSAGNRKTWTWAGWVKRAKLGSDQTIFSADYGSGNWFVIQLNASNALQVNWTTGTGGAYLLTNQLFRDPASWFHLVVAFNTTQSTSSERVKLYINGTQVTSFSNEQYPNQNTDYQVNNNVVHNIGYGAAYADLYLADVYFIDGQALDPTSFGEFDATTGVWNPIEYTFGTNPNNGTTWSSSLTSSTGSYAGGYPATAAFDGSTGTAAATSTGGGLSVYLTWSPSGFNTADHSVRVYTYSGYKIEIDGVEKNPDGAGGGGSAGWIDCGTISGGFSTIRVYGNNAANSGSAIYAIEVDGYVLINGAGDNSFHLDFADNSSAAALGYDAAGSNDWTVNNITANATVYSSGSFTTGTNQGNVNNAFDSTVSGSLSSPVGVYTDTGAQLTYTFPSSISYTSSVELYAWRATSAPGITYFALGTSLTGATNFYSSLTTSGQWITIASGSGSFSAISSQDQQGAGGYGAVRVDGVLLVDGVPANQDSLRDSPTNGDTSDDTGAGGEVPGNYCTWNPLANPSQVTLSQGNLNISAGAGSPSTYSSNSTIGVSDGKWYWEATAVTAGTNSNLGISKSGRIDIAPGYEIGGYGWQAETATKVVEGANTSGYGSAATTGSVVMFALDMTNLKFYVGKDGTWFDSGNPVTGTNPLATISAGTYFATARPYHASGTCEWAFNWGQRAFAHTAPSGFKALCTANLDTPLIEDPSTVMDVLTWTGDGTGDRSFTSLAFSPDLVWAKMRTLSSYSHLLYDFVRGGGSGKDLSSDLGEAEGSAAVAASAYGYLNTFDSTGFSTKAGSTGNNDYFNANTRAYVAWTWDAGTSNATNTSGTITSTVRANATAGFSIVSYVGNANSTDTFGHGLGVTPHMVIIKSRALPAASWIVWHRSASTADDHYLILNSTAAVATNSALFQGVSSSLITVGYADNVNTTVSPGNIAYCFAPVAGYSAFGSYTGNGSSTSSPFVWTGFNVRYLMIKNSSRSNTSWVIHDTARQSYNTQGPQLLAQSSNAEYTELTLVDMYSNGFSPKRTVIDYNYSGDTYIYAAFAENPFKYARAR